MSSLLGLRMNPMIAKAMGTAVVDTRRRPPDRRIPRGGAKPRKGHSEVGEESSAAIITDVVVMIRTTTMTTLRHRTTRTKHPRYRHLARTKTKAAPTIPRHHPTLLPFPRQMTAAAIEGEDGGINIITVAAMDGSDHFRSQQQHRQWGQMGF